MGKEILGYRVDDRNALVPDIGREAVQRIVQLGGLSDQGIVLRQ